MKLGIVKALTKYLPGTYEKLTTGVAFLALSLPGVAMLFFSHDAIFSTGHAEVRAIGMALELVLSVSGISLIVWALRDSAPVGTLLFRLTHPRFHRRSR